MTTLDLDAIDLPRLTVPQRLKEAARLAWITLATGRQIEGHAIANGLRHGMDGGFAAALGEFNARLASQGIDPVRGPR